MKKLAKNLKFAVKGIALFSTALITLTGCSKGNSNTIKIGGLAPLSGQYTEYGLECKKGIDLAVEEIFVNIAHYAYSGRGGEAEVSCILSDGVITISFTDKGKPFNPLEKEDPDITLSAEERKIGGLGIFLTKKFMDKVWYVYEDGRNKLSFSKKIIQ